MATKTQLYNQDGTSDDRFLFDLPHWAFGDEGPLLARIGLSAQPFQAHGSPPNTMGPLFEPDVFSGFTADAMGGPGGRPGGGGGGPGLLTTYTSGNPDVADASEFNIQINFSGSWTAKQQAIVTWAADTYSKIITSDIRDDLDLNGHLVDDIVISVSTGRIDGKGNPLSGDILAQTGNIVVRDAGTVDQWLPLTASIKLDSTDLKDSALAGTWDDIILHEMGHALGFVGTIFAQLGWLMVLETLPGRMLRPPMEAWCRWRTAAAAVRPARIGMKLTSSRTAYRCPTS